MNSVLVIGGYGGFGARLSRALAGDGYAVMVAGRNFARAELFCRDLPNATPLELDRTKLTAEQLACYRPDLVIDAAGPFQSCGYQVPQACIAARIPYLDLADGRDFVCGIGVLDNAARAAGVPIVSGASSVPALSGAVIRHLAADVDHIDNIEIAISASNRATAGASVAASILSYVGKPVRLWQDGRWNIGYGWQKLKRQRYDHPDGARFHRLVALADVPDLSIFPEILDGAPSVIFRAGPELAFQTLALWLMSWPIRWGWIASLEPFINRLNQLHGLTAHWGGDRSAMRVEVKGRCRGGAKAVVWTLVAESGDGPNIPIMPTRLLISMIMNGKIGPGTQNAAELLTLDQFDQRFKDFNICHHSTVLPDRVF